ncbi:hypothetical protein K450DRAFT_236672 [Umbelopsis ramanniana AG]|uniref:Telomere-associated protein Rif1 N-terminal domain-containing protein n=1 Tax=Umbelopsis ramanniana AG TaxID=1314678 RepID=A0AAD5EE91_UMBRA|nr:uncharacterized protein K450DRAFT_236672 [Umbelopsis ramanniana AG]KAI8580660.1 hypothetical protein K450DRAFT_236672 [Umbelopsis ramanniana AG]
MSDRGRDSRMDSLKALYDLKKNNPNDTTTENNFYNAVLSYLLQDKTDHWWCNKSLEPFVRESMMLFSLPEYDHITKYKNRMNMQLRTCRHCLTSYHNSKSALRQSYEQLYSVENVAQFFQQLERFDASRIHLTLQEILTPPAGPKQTSSSSIDSNNVFCAILDITISPAVLNVNNLDQEFSSAIMTMQNSTSLRIPELDMSPGLFSLTLHKNKIIRLFSRKQIERFTTRGQDLDKQHADVLKPFAKRLLIYLGSLNPTHSKAEIHPVDEPFALTDQPGEYWKSFRYLASCVAAPPLLIWIRSSPTNMESLIQSHLEDGSMWFHEVLKLLAVLLTKLKSQFWSSPPTHLSDFSKYIDSIFSNRVFRNLMQLLSQGNGKTVVHQNDGTPIPFEKVAIRLNGILEWIFPFWLSFTGTAIYVPMTEMILDYMFNLFQQNNTPTLMRAKCVEIGMSIISEAITLDGRPSSAFINKYAALIVKSSISPNSKTLETKVKTGQPLLEQLLMSDVDAVRDTYFSLYAIVPSKRSEPSNRGICEKIWKEVCGINFDYCVPAQMDVVTSIFKAHSVIALLDMDIMQDAQQHSESKQQQIQFLIDSLMIIRTNVQPLLQALLDQQGNQLSRLMNNDIVASRTLHIVSSPDRDIRSIGVTMFKTAYREDAFIDCLIQYLRTNPNNGLDAITQLMLDFTEFIDGGCNMFSTSGPVFATLASVVSALVGNEDSLLFNVITSGDLSTAGDLDKLQKLWSFFWIFVGKSVKAALVWAQSYRPKEVVKAVLPVLQIASQVIGTFRTFEQIAQMKDASKENSTHWSSPSSSMLSYTELANALDPLSEWIFVTSHDVLRLLVPLLIMSLKRLTQTQVKVSSNTYDRLMGAATGAVDSRVTTDEKENMFMALSPHDPANTVFFDESDDDDNGNWVTTDSNTNFSTNFLDSSLLNATHSTPSIPIVAPPISPKRLRQPTLAESFAAAVGKSPDSPSQTTKNVRSQMKLTDFLAKPKADAIVLTDEDDTPKPVKATQKKETNQEDEFDDEFEDMDFTDIPEEWFDEQKIRLESQKASGESEEKLKAHRLERLRIAQANMHARKASRQNRVHMQQTTPTYAVGPSRGGLPGKKLRPPTMGLSKLQALRKEFSTSRVYPSATSTQSRREQGSQQDSDDSGDESAFAELVSDFDKSKESHAPKEKEKFSGAIFDDRPRRSVKLIDAPVTAGSNFQEKKAQMQRALARKKKVTPSMRGLHKTILAWDVTVEGEVPPNASRDMYKRVPSKFSDVHEYTQIFEPLLLLEVWMQLMRAKEEATESDVIDNCMIESRCNVDEFVDVTFQMTIASGRSLAVEDLVFIANHFGSSFFNKSDGQHHKWVGKGFLSKVKSMVYKKDLADVTVRCFFPPSQMIMLNSLAPKSIWRALKLSSLTTAHREYSALKALEYYDLRDMILQPKHLPTAPISERELVRCMNTFKVNQPQAEAIMGTIRRPKGFTLIQG